MVDVAEMPDFSDPPDFVDEMTEEGMPFCVFFSLEYMFT